MPHGKTAVKEKKTNREKLRVQKKKNADGTNLVDVVAEHASSETLDSNVLLTPLTEIDGTERAFAEL
jgi:replication fork clamp-binding protein CrfC